MHEIKVVEREAFYVRMNRLKPKVVEDLKEANKFFFYEEKACKECEWLPERHNDVCDRCAAFKGGVMLAKEMKIGDNAYLSVPVGDKTILEGVLGRHNLQPVYVHKNKERLMKRPIKFTGTLKPHQDEAMRVAIKKRRGVIKAPPRSGKTVTACALVCELGQKTIILAAQREWLEGFRETFCGSETQKALTNAKQAQVGFAKKLEDFQKYDVCLVTYQTFNSVKGKALLEKIKGMFGIMIVDEVHMGAATNFAICISRLQTKYKIGLSGTPSRKDLRYVIAHALIGPIIYEAKVARLRPHVRLVRTGYTKTWGRRPLWTTMISSLEKDPKRLKLIAEWALRDVKDGHMILIPMAQVTPIKALVMAINRIAGKRVAHAFHGGLKKDQRKQLITDARNYKARILVGSTKLLSTGTNIPRASAIYDVTMSANQENCEQRVSRILTPWDDKPNPLLRIFLDETSIRKRCLASEWYQTVVPKFKPVISERDQIALAEYLKDKPKNSVAAWDL